MDIIKVIIVDDHIIFRKGLITVLNEMDDVKVVGEASNGHELLDLVKKQATDVVLMDIKMPVMDGVEATRKVAEKHPAVKVVALTMFEEVTYFNRMIEAGACGFLLKKTTSTELERALHLVMEDESYFSEEFISSANKFFKTKQKDPTIKLTDREQEVLDLICKGYSNAEISRFLGLSQRTIDGHRAKLFEKTGAKNAPNLVMFAIKNGWVEV